MTSKEKLIELLGLKEEDFHPKEVSIEDRLNIVEDVLVEILGGAE